MRETNEIFAAGGKSGKLGKRMNVAATSTTTTTMRVSGVREKDREHDKIYACT